ncbi:MAG: fibronectin type III domain-containing protein, partial [Candidatus Thermoplasmatota archaeon]|nr:fibronectin type III domain-containing protein [Candidatus Thermoplasmatota archaeon]
YLDTNVTFNTTYYYSMRASNVVGTGPLSEVRSIVILRSPGSCQDIEVTAGNAFVMLEWSPPPNDGGSPITGYVIYRGVFETGLSELDKIGLITLYNDSHVDNGMTYYYTVIAQNAIGRGNISQVINATPRGPPIGPVFVVHEVRDGKVFLSWFQPVGGDSSVSGYLLKKRVSWAAESQHISLDGQVKEYTDEDVEPGKTYYYNLFAVNEYGISQASETLKIHIDDEEGGWDTFGSYILSIIIGLCAIAILLLYRKVGRVGRK